MSKKKLYSISLLFITAGYLYVAYSLSHPAELYNGQHTTCLFKTVTGIPCPSCGSTRAVVSLMQGHIADALQWNPLGFLLFIALLVIPLLIVYDVVSRKSTFFATYQWVESFFRRKPVMYVAIALVLVNWIWNINKGL